MDRKERIDFNDNEVFASYREASNSSQIRGDQLTEPTEARELNTNMESNSSVEVLISPHSSIELFSDEASHSPFKLQKNEMISTRPYNNLKSYQRLFDNESTNQSSMRCSSSQHRPHSSLGASVTPFKIRDNIHHLLNIHQKDNVDDEEIFQKPKLPSMIPKNNTDSKGRKMLFKRLCNFSGIPASRLLLIDHNQTSAFIFQVKKIRRSQPEFKLYYEWTNWTESSQASSKKYVSQEMIDSNVSLEKFFKTFRKQCNSGSIRHHFLRLGYVPRRKSPQMINSGTIEIQVSLEDGAEVYEHLCESASYGYSHNRFFPQIPVCGVSYKRQPLYTIISLWLSAPREPASDQHIFNYSDLTGFLEFISEVLSDGFKQHLISAVFIENDTLEVHNLF